MINKKRSIYVLAFLAIIIFITIIALRVYIDGKISFRISECKMTELKQGELNEISIGKFHESTIDKSIVNLIMKNPNNYSCLLIKCRVKNDSFKCIGNVEPEFILQDNLKSDIIFYDKNGLKGFGGFVLNNNIMNDGIFAIVKKDKSEKYYYNELMKTKVKLKYDIIWINDGTIEQ